MRLKHNSFFSGFFCNFFVLWDVGGKKVSLLLTGSVLQGLRNCIVFYHSEKLLLSV